MGRFRSCGAVFLVVEAVWFSADARAQRTALDVYHHVTSIREEQALPLIEAANASPQDLRQGIAFLDEALSFLNRPENRDLANGHAATRFRSFNLLWDRARAFVKLGDKEEAIRCLERMHRIGSGPFLSKMLESDSWQDLEEHADFRKLVEKVRAEARSCGLPTESHLDDGAKVAGLSTLWSRAKRDFVYFDQVPGLDWDHAYMQAVPRMLATQSPMDYVRELSRFMALLNDGHTSVIPSDALAREHYLRPGIRTARIGDHVVVIEVVDAEAEEAGIEVGDIVLTLDGMDVFAYVDKFVRPFVCSSTPQYRDVRCFDYELLNGPRDSEMRLGLRDATGREGEVTLTRRRARLGRDRPRVRFEMLEGEIAYLECRTFANGQGAERLRKEMATIQGTMGLIVDLRENGGGSTSHGYALLAQLLSESVKGVLQRHRVHDSLSTARTGERIDWVTQDLPIIEPAPSVFEGPVVVLIGPRTFSAAEDFLVSFDVSERGAMIGSATGGSTGQPSIFDLPGGLRARICVKRDSYPDGTEFVGVGIEPDIEVEATLEAIREGRDLVLETAIEYLDEGGA